MAEYIKRYDKVDCYLNPKCLERPKNQIEQIPTADVVEVVHGEWVKTSIPFDCDFETGLVRFINIHKCSVCGCEIPKGCVGECLIVSLTYKFCPNCGADMRGDKNG